MKPSQNAINLIKKWEGFRTNAYLCSAGVATIGYGSTTWGNGQKVKIGEIVSMKTAEVLLLNDLAKRSKVLQGLNLNQNQFDALLSFIYNVGIGAFNRSQLKKLIVANPNDEAIREQFMRWKKAGGKISQGLINRRTDEANLYFYE
jgi:lysozyme